MSILYSNETAVLNALLGLDFVHKISTERANFWRECVANSELQYGALTTITHKKVELQPREYVYHAAFSLALMVSNLPGEEKKLLVEIRSLRDAKSIVAKSIYDDLNNLTIYIARNLTFDEKVFFLLLANASK